MAIAATGGTLANNSGSVTSLALPAYTSHSGQDVVIAVVLGSTSSSVSSISTSAGTYGTPTLRIAKNGTGVRVEVWTIHVTTGAATIFTVNISGGTSVEANLEEYSGVSSIGNTDSNSGSVRFMSDVGVTIQDGNNWVVTGFGFACQSGDTLTATAGTSRQSSIPAATAVGGALYDNTQALTAPFGNQSRISTSRNWAAASIELRSGSAVISAVDYGSATVASLQAPRDVRYLHCLEPVFMQTQLFPFQPATSATNSGFVY